MTQSEFITFVQEEAKKLIFEPVSAVDEMFQPFIEDGTLEGFDYDFNLTDNSVKIIFKFASGDEFILTIGKAEDQK
jgi:hypothetical protein